jgi:transposase-like protein
MFDMVWNELRDAEEVCEKTCLISHTEPSAWQRECIEVCLKCWKMTKRGECAKRIHGRYVEHVHVMETILKLYGFWYHSYSYIEIDKKVLFVMEFKPPPTTAKNLNTA